ncbi:uncharacterized protein LOC114534512 [Dendronephthya gigantea]|uniref:uncharacterized protein LOC114534512 n=1 Tax=Dendronephthya gigantea TaxID=151771 RepID=UPI00106B8045|nr:uncharacterized protein LOC114534512 [Dendronephthya gigantea]
MAHGSDQMAAWTKNEYLKLFCREVAKELLYNIVYNHAGNDYSSLCSEFTRKTGHGLMNFVGFSNVSEQEWSSFLKNILGLKHIPGQRPKICFTGSVDGERGIVYRRNNTTYLTVGYFVQTIATYREKFLVMACKMMKDIFPNLNRCKNKMGNTPLHLVSSLPGHYVQNDNTVPLVKYLIQAGIDSTMLNSNRRNFLHTISWSFVAEDTGDVVKWVSENEYFYYFICTINSTRYVKERYAILHTLLVGLTPEQLLFLVSTKDSLGNTVMHGWAHLMSVLNVESDFQFTSSFLEMLCSFTGSEPGLPLDDTDINGNVALHYAFHPKVFKFFLQKEVFGCRITNKAGATPVLTMLQHLAVLAFNETSAFAEIKSLFSCGNGDYKWIRYKRPLIEEATNMFEQFIDLVSDNEDVQETLGIPDENGNYPINVVLITIRVACYRIEKPRNNVLDYTKLRECLIRLVGLILGTVNTMKLQNNEGKNALHVFLDMGEANNNRVLYDEDILEIIKILLQHNLNVNAIDAKGNTPLHVANKYYYSESNKRIAEMLINYGAVADKKRVLRSCPTRHQDKAQRLIDNTIEVTFVGKYRYCSQDPIGSGAFSTVFVAVRDEFVESDTINYKAFALKRLEKARLNGDQFQREIKNLISLSEGCEKIIRYYHNFTDNSFHYIVLALMDGDLYKFIKNDNIKQVVMRDPAIQLRVMRDVITGVEYLHNNNYIHRDLNPRNILYTADATLHLKIADFGFTKNISSTSTKSSGRGGRTPCWIAPELLVRQPLGHHTKQSDIFSLGLVLYYLYTWGSHPFGDLEHEQPHRIVSRIENFDERFMPQIFNSHGVYHPESISFFMDLLKRYPFLRSRANGLIQKPFFWNDSKKIAFLNAIGNQDEAIFPDHHSRLVQFLQETHTGHMVSVRPWHQWNTVVRDVHKEMSRNKRYRTNMIIDLLRFIRNAYAHRNEKSFRVQVYLDDKIFLHTYPSLVLDVFNVIQRLGLRERRRDINDVLKEDQ